MSKLNATCGTLTALQNRSDKKQGTVQLPVAIVPSLSKEPSQPDPVVYMAGGPGANAIAQAQQLVDVGLNQRRELIIMNQRGNLYTVPDLTCPEIDQAFAAAVLLPYDSDANKNQHVAAVQTCHDRLVSQGVNLGNFNTAEDAADFADLRKALKLKEWNVYGLSYGTDVALTLLRDHPEGIRSVMIDAVLPPSAVTLGWTWTNANEAIHNVFTACANQPNCVATYGDLEAKFTAQVQQLEANPLTVHDVQIPGTTDTTDVVLDGGAILNWIASIPDPVTPIADLAASIQQLVNGTPTQIAQTRALAANPAGFGATGYGPFYDVICSEWVPFEPTSQILVQGNLAFPAFPQTVLAQPPGLPFMTEDCQVWNVPAASGSVRQVTVSDIPTLVLNGSFDGKSAPQWGIYAAGTLQNSTVVTIPSSGHGALFQIQMPPDAPSRQCAQDIVASFLANPSAPDTSCAASLTNVPFN
ncbi:MAG TPA: alpha/beta hydrolase [Candidatus Binataceae bacterium]|nr:alpha/beta hydrolase [Candidatus Binataceae bacterium]